MIFNSKITLETIPGLIEWMDQADHYLLKDKVVALQDEFVLPKQDVAELFRLYAERVLK